jgi:hypothetical protein
MKSKKDKPLPLALVVKVALQLQSRPENKNEPIEKSIQMAIDFITVADRINDAHYVAQIVLTERMENSDKKGPIKEEIAERMKALSKGKNGKS